jgi:hypothetical protein
MQDKLWSNEDLINYVSLFKDQQREYVLKQILESDILARFMDTSEGRLILGTVVDDITANTMNIISAATSDKPDKSVPEITNYAREINVAYRFMHRLAEIATKGDAHAEGIKKAKR